MIDRHQYVEKLKAKLDQWDRDLDVLEARVRDTSGELRQRSQQALADLQATQRQLGERLNELVHTTDDAWQRIRLSLDAALDNVKSGLAAAREELRPTPRPPEPPAPQA